MPIWSTKLVLFIKCANTVLLILPIYHPQSVLGAALSGEDVELAEFLDLFLYSPFGNAEVIG